MKKNPKNVKVFVSRIFPDKGVSMLKKEGFEVGQWTEERPMTQKELISRMKLFNALFCSGSDKLDKHFFNECGHIEIISQFAVGYDNIDVSEATILGIPVGNTPDVLSDATADVAFALLLNVSRKMFYMHKTIKKGEWKYFRPLANLGIEIRNKTLGIFGLGRIGSVMARLCKAAYNMDIIYNNRSRNTRAEKELGARFVSFDHLLEYSDVISIHTDLNSETAGRFDRKAFNKMKPTAIFINTSRGLIHNENDLIEALEMGTIWGAGLDVTNPEPMKPSNPLLSMENVAVLPHIGSATVETRDKMAEQAVGNIIEFYRGNEIPNLVNPGVFGR